MCAAARAWWKAYMRCRVHIGSCTGFPWNNIFIPNRDYYIYKYIYFLYKRGQRRWCRCRDWNYVFDADVVYTAFYSTYNTYGIEDYIISTAMWSRLIPLNYGITYVWLLFASLKFLVFSSPLCLRIKNCWAVAMPLLLAIQILRQIKYNIYIRKFLYHILIQYLHSKYLELYLIASAGVAIIMYNWLLFLIFFKFTLYSYHISSICFFFSIFNR